MRLFLIITIALLVACGTAFAQAGPRNQPENRGGQQKSYLYQWTDDQGVLHATDDLDKVPNKYRNKTLKMEEVPSGEEPPQGQQNITEPSGAGSAEEIDQERKAEWQQRIKQARQRLADAQRRYQELEQKRNEALVQWAGGASGNIALKQEADRIEQEMSNVQREINDARNQLENVIPEEARRAGVPPGWLRE
jgi:chromosome segregation ATPase